MILRPGDEILMLDDGFADIPKNKKACVEKVKIGQGEGNQIVLIRGTWYSSDRFALVNRA